MTFNRRILIQVTLPAFLIGALLLGACLFTLRSLHQLQVNRSRILSNDVASLLAAQELVTRLRQLRFHSLLVVMDPTPARKAVVAVDHQQFEKALERARQAASQPDELPLLRTIEDAYARYRRAMDEAARKLSPHPTVAELLAWADAHPLRSVVQPCEELLELHQKTLEARTESGEQVVSQTRWTLSLIALLGPLSGLAWDFGVAWGLSRSITRLSVRLQDVHAHLDQELGQVRLSAEGDLHQLDRQLETILSRVREVVTRLQEREREVLRAEQLSAVGQLAAGVAHEIRNPLSSIKLLVGAALGGRGSGRAARPPSPLTPEDLQVIHDEVERLERKIQALLDFARPTQASKQALPLKALLEQALHLVQTRLRQQKVEVELNGADRPITVSVDQDQFLSVLVNLFLNALDAMPQGGKLQVTVEQNPAGEVRVQVADTGPGIDPAVAGRLFTPFTSTKPTGTGLGLSVCRRIIEDYGGRLTAANRPEGGACLTISLPASSSEALLESSDMPTILLVDDEEGFRYSFRRVFARDETEVLTAATVAEGRTLFRERRPDVVVLDLQLPDGTGMDVFETILAEDPRRPVIFITAHGTAGTALEAMKRGAFDYLLKPVDFERLNDILQRAIEAARLMQVPAVLPALEPSEPIIGRSSAIQEVCKTIGRVAPLEVNVLILGESGVGKELVARALYHHSHRADRSFLAVNCAAMPEGLIESELFGHEKGAFTGAERKRIGKFEQCNDGTLFLDEIGDMPLAAQAKMLRVLQEQRFERVGGVETVQTHVRIIAATNQDLEKRIAESRFRADLYYRLRGISIVVPPLRERSEDIPELAHHFLFLFDREMGLRLTGFDPEALALLQQYAWPGNVRELRSVIQEAMLHSPGPLVLPEALPAELRAAPPTPAAAPPERSAPGLGGLIDDLIQRGENDLYAKVIRQVEQELFTRVLRATHGHQAQASDRLGLNRTTLRYKLRDLGLHIDRIVGEPPAE